MGSKAEMVTAITEEEFEHSSDDSLPDHPPEVKKSVEAPKKVVKAAQDHIDMGHDDKWDDDKSAEDKSEVKVVKKVVKKSVEAPKKVVKVAQDHEVKKVAKLSLNSDDIAMDQDVEVKHHGMHHGMDSEMDRDRSDGHDDMDRLRSNYHHSDDDED